MTNQDIALGISVANFFLTWGVALYMYLANKNKATNERIGALEESFDKKLGDHVERLGVLEGKVAAAPGHEDLAAIHEKINDVAAEVAKMSGSIDGMSAQLRQILNRIIERGMP